MSATTVLLFNVALLALLLLMQPLMRSAKLGLRYALSNLDERVDEGVLARRLAMVKRNQIEALAVLVPLVLVAPGLAASHPQAGWAASTFLLARLAYTAVSLAGIPVLRSTAWVIGFAAATYYGVVVWTLS